MCIYWSQSVHSVDEKSACNTNSEFVRMWVVAYVKVQTQYLDVIIQKTTRNDRIDVHSTDILSRNIPNATQWRF
jgi:hypothetical protein